MSNRLHAPRLSVIMPAFNAARTLARAIDSVLDQDMHDIELIVVDDGSSDDTVSWLRERASTDPRLHLLQQPMNLGPAVARNAGFDRARGEWIGLLDADDAWLPGRASRLVTLAESHNVDVMADNQWLYDATAERMVRKGFAMRSDLQPFGLEDMLCNDISGGLFVFGWLKPLMRRTFLQTHSLRYLTHLRYGEDFNLYMRMFGLGARGLLTREAMYVYTQRNGSISRARSEHSRTIPSSAVLLKDMEQLLEEFKPHLTPRAISLMRRRADHLVSWPDALHVRQLLSERKYLAAIDVLVTRPRTFSALFRAIYTRLRQRMGFI